MTRKTNKSKFKVMCENCNNETVDIEDEKDNANDVITDIKDEDDEVTETDPSNLSLSEIKSICKQSKIKLSYITEDGKRKKKSKSQLMAELNKD